MGSRVGMAGLALALVVASAWYLATREAQDSGVGSTRTAPIVKGASPSSAGPSSVPATVPSSTVADSPVAEVPNSPAAAADSPLQTQTPVAQALPSEPLWGLVREASTGLPCANYRVLLSAGVDANCDSGGRFELDWELAQAAPGDLRTLHVYSPDGAHVAATPRRLEQGLELLVDRVVVLSGRVIDSAGRPVPADGVVVCDPWKEAIASAEVDARDGTFRVPVAAARAEHEVLLMDIELDSGIYPRRSLTSDLLRAEGATLVLDLCSVRFQARISDGEPPDATKLRLLVRRRGERSPKLLESARSMSHLNSGAFPLDPAGKIDVTFDTNLADVTVLASLQGYATWVETRTVLPCDTVWEIPLQRLVADDVITGRVLSSHGSPVNTVVLCSPGGVDREVQFYGTEMHAFTDENGAFSVPFARGKSAMLRVHSNETGTELRKLVHGGDRDVELRFDPLQRVVLIPVGPEGGRPIVDDPLVHSVSALADGSIRRDRGSVDRLELVDVPPGTHRVAVFAGMPGQFACFELVIEAGEDLRLDVPMVPGFRTTGRVMDRNDVPMSGVRVRVVDAPWPDGAQDDPFDARTRPDGWFQVFLGDRPQTEVELSYEGRESVRVRVEADTPATWTIP
jgi:hypothetical protein